MSYQVLDVGIASSNTISEDMLDVEPNWNNCIKFLQEIIPLLIEIAIFKINKISKETLCKSVQLCRKNNTMPI